LFLFIFIIIETVGKGSFASVYKVIRKSDNKVYALKRVKINKMTKKEIADALNEIRFLASIRHKNVVGFLESFLENNETELCIIMEYCGCGDLAQKVERYKKRRQYIDEHVIWRYLVQCLKALQHLHEKNICHRDIKVANTFLAEDGSIKIGDMNVSKRLTKGQLQTQIGTPYYMSPEIWNNRPYDSSSDIWAVGCMFYELASLKPPFTGNSFPELKRAVTAGRYQPIPKKYGDALHKVIGMMLRVNAKERPSARQLLESADMASKLQYDDVTVFQPSSAREALMETIRVPQNLRKLNCALPKPCYPDMRPNSPTAWTADEQDKKLKIRPAVPPPPPVDSENVAPEVPETSREASKANVAPMKVPALSAIAEYYNRRPLAPVVPADNKQAYGYNPNPPVAAYKRAAAIPGVAPPPPQRAAGYPSRLQQYQHRMW